MNEYKRRRKLGIRLSLLYGIHRETGTPPKISLRLFHIRISEYETGMMTIRQITASYLALLRSQQILSWSKNYVYPNMYFLL
jgi:hypothetical protein